MKSLFKTEHGKRKILSLYDQKLKELNIDHEYLNLKTSFGLTNIITSGNPSNPPLVILHGSNGCAPIGLETYPTLSKHYRVYTIDVLGQPNKSEGTILNMKDDSYGQWLNEIITSLNIEQVTMVGFSFGGLIILKTLEHNERKIKEVFLSAPAYIVNGNTIKAIFKIFIPMKRYMKTQKSKYIERFLGAVFTDRDQFAINYLSNVFLHFKMDFSPIPVINMNKAKLIKTPITLFAAKKDIIFPGSKMIKRAKKIFPTLKNNILFEDSKHVHSRIHLDLIEKTIIESL